MGIVRWFLRVIVVLFLVRLAVNFFRGAMTRTSGGRPGGRTRPAERLGGKLVKCPECGTHVTEDKVVAYGRGDTEQSFCSSLCRDAWVAHRSSEATARGSV